MYPLWSHQSHASHASVPLRIKDFSRKVEQKNTPFFGKTEWEIDSRERKNNQKSENCKKWSKSGLTHPFKNIDFTNCKSIDLFGTAFWTSFCNFLFFCCFFSLLNRFPIWFSQKMVLTFFEIATEIFDPERH